MSKFRRILISGLLLLLISLISQGIAQTGIAHAATNTSARSSSATTTYYYYDHSDKNTNQGFDLCTTPSLGQMQNWWDGTPYGWVGTYLAGSENLAPGCNISNLSGSWVSGIRGQGWSLVPIWDGLNAPCTSLSTRVISTTPNTAFSQGANDGLAAANSAESVGIGPGSILYDDIEYFASNNSTCNLAVAEFVNGWTAELHTLGFKSGVYESDSDLSSLCADAGFISPPDDIWIAAWDGNSSQSDITSLPPNGCWVYQQRLHQYNGGVTLTYNGTRLNVDLDSANGDTSD